MRGAAAAMTALTTSAYWQGDTNIPNEYPIVYNAEHNMYAIGGTCCCGKTTLLPELHRIKVNEYLGAERSAYNFDPIVAHEYLTKSIAILAGSDNLIMDRTPLDNIAYQMTYYLMRHAGRRSRLSPFGLCREYIDAHGLSRLLQAVSGRYNMLFIIDSNVARLQERMRQRGSRGDLAKCSSDRYSYQNAAFAYLSHRCRIRLFDLASLCSTDDISSGLEYIRSQLKFDTTKVPKYPALPHTSVNATDPMDARKTHTLMLKQCKR